MTTIRMTKLAVAAVWAAAAGVAALQPSSAWAQMMPVPMMPGPQPLLPAQNMPPTIEAGTAYAAPALPMVPVPGPQVPRVEFYSSEPVYSPGDEGGRVAAARNNAESRRYEAALQSNPGFRDRRMQQECGGFANPSVYQGCIDTFGNRTASASPR